MNVLSVLAATESGAHAALPFPAVVFGLIAAVVFLALGVVTWSYRDVSSRHSQKWSEGDSANGHH
jgi:hypothetical protein